MCGNIVLSIRTRSLCENNKQTKTIIYRRIFHDGTIAKFRISPSPVPRAKSDAVIKRVGCTRNYSITPGKPSVFHTNARPFCRLLYCIVFIFSRSKYNIWKKRGNVRKNTRRDRFEVSRLSISFAGDWCDMRAEASENRNTRNVKWIEIKLAGNSEPFTGSHAG